MEEIISLKYDIARRKIILLHIARFFSFFYISLYIVVYIAETGDYMCTYTILLSSPELYLMFIKGLLKRGTKSVCVYAEV